MPPTSDPPAFATATIQLGFGSKRIELEVTVPTSPVPPRAVLPLARAITELMVEESIEATRQAGQTVSCKKGCSACCHQLIPVSETEARHLAKLIELMQPERREAVRAKAAAGQAKLAELGQLDALKNPPPWPDGTNYQPLMDYVHAKIACQFLDDDGSCSIYAERPLVCREFLVTSPAEDCSRPFQGVIQPVELLGPSPFRTWSRASSGAAGPRDPVKWVPLILATEWAAEHPEEPCHRTGQELVQSVLEHMTGAIQRTDG